MTIVNITPEMRTMAYDFSESIINRNNQYDRMTPEYANNHEIRNIVRINRTYVGKLAELCFHEYLQQRGVYVNIDDMFEIYEGQENVDHFDFNLPNGETIDVKAAVFSNHHNLVVPIDQFNNTPKDYYVGIKYSCNLQGNDYRLINRQTFNAATIRGYCLYDDLRRRRTVNLGEFPCKAYPLNNLININGLISMFRA